jgi:hypothetical protein
MPSPLAGVRAEKQQKPSMGDDLVQENNEYPQSLSDTELRSSDYSN